MGNGKCRADGGGSGSVKKQQAIAVETKVAVILYWKIMVSD